MRSRSAHLGSRGGGRIWQGVGETESYEDYNCVVVARGCNKHGLAPELQKEGFGPDKDVWE